MIATLLYVLEYIYKEIFFFLNQFIIYLKLGPLFHLNKYKEYLNINNNIYKNSFSKFLNNVNGIYNPKNHSININL